MAPALGASSRPCKHCLLIANGKFPEFPALGDLVTPMGDIEALLPALQPSDGWSRDTFTTNVLRDATAEEIFLALRTMLQAAERTDLVVIYYSGHGMLNREMELILAAHDTDGDADTCLPNRRVKFADLHAEVDNRNLSRVLFVLDCCHSAAAGGKNIEPKADLAGALSAGVREQTRRLAFADVGGNMTRRSDEYRDYEAKGDDRGGTGVYLLAACGVSQVAKGDRNNGMGVFTKHLCDGLKGEAVVAAQKGSPIQGFIPVSRLFKYVSTMMGTDPDQKQKPLLFCRNVTGDDMVITNIYGQTGYKPGRLAASTAFWEPVPTLENVTPSYILEGNEVYTFVDWNATFEAVVAAPMRLVRGMHVQEFLKHLDNWESEVKSRSMRTFPPGGAPRVDTEKLEVQTRRFGLIVFHKIASRLRDGSGRWVVNLNASYVQRAEEFWKYIEAVMERDEMWSAYAESYDPIISSFQDNQDLVQFVVDQVDGAKRCLDVGAGTGSTTVRLLATNPEREVVAIDINKKMLEQLDRKLDANPDYRRRTKLRLGDCHAVLSRTVKTTDGVAEESEFPDESFDACVMMNVLFALDDPVQCLSEIYRILKPDGVLSISTSHGSTNIDRLFRRINESLVVAGEWEAKKALFESAKARNQEMNPIIIRYNRMDIKRFLEQAGFTVEPDPQERYVGCVLVYKAVKKRQVAVRVPERPAATPRRGRKESAGPRIGSG
ncbi:MAG TPA: methyltransferase domain-containing protein [Urbifossiella sp.]|nr:methyltransferase domain-containing protein [Urbifossiella sp.]